VILFQDVTEGGDQALLFALEAALETFRFSQTQFRNVIVASSSIWPNSVTIDQIQKKVAERFDVRLAGQWLRRLQPKN